MKTIILVAGKGTRLKPLTDSIPKCLTEVNGKPILINALENLEANNVEEVRLVIGYLGDIIRERVGERFGNMKISYSVNDVYDKTSTSYSLWLGLKDLVVEDELLILEGDVFFEKKLLSDFLRDSDSPSTIVQKYTSSLDGSFVELNQDVVIDWVHKTARPLDYVIENKFKTVNIHRFNKYFLENVLKPFLEKHIKLGGRAPMEFLFQDIVKNNHKINAFKVNGLKWFEIDDISDLRFAEEIFKNIPSTNTLSLT